MSASPCGSPADEWKCRGMCDNLTLACVCDGDKRNDFTLARLKNCGAPSLQSEQAAIGFSIALGGVILVYLSFRLRTAKMRTRSILICGIYSNICITIALCIHLGTQRASTAFWFFFAMFAAGIGATLGAVFDAFLRISYGAALTVYPERFVWFALAVLVACLVVPFLVCFAGTFFDDETYNRILTIGFALIPLHLIVSAPLFFSCISQLLERTDAVLNRRMSTAPGPLKQRSPSVFKGAVPALPIRRVSDTSLVAGLDPPLSNEHDAENNPVFREQMRSLGKRLRIFRWVMAAVWAPIEIFVSATLACMVALELPYLCYVFYVLISVSQLVSVTVVNLVVSRTPKHSVQAGGGGSLTNNTSDHNNKADRTSIRNSRDIPKATDQMRNPTPNF